MDFNTDVASGDFVVEGMNETIEHYHYRLAVEDFERKFPRKTHERTFSEGGDPAGVKRKKLCEQPNVANAQGGLGNRRKSF